MTEDDQNPGTRTHPPGTEYARAAEQQLPRRRGECTVVEEPPVRKVERMPAVLPRVSSSDLLKGLRELIIEHAGEEYRLRLTSNGKLILTK